MLTFQVAYTIAIRVLVWPWVNLVDWCMMPPVIPPSKARAKKAKKANNDAKLQHDGNKSDPNNEQKRTRIWEKPAAWTFISGNDYETFECLQFTSHVKMQTFYIIRGGIDGINKKIGGETEMIGCWFLEWAWMVFAVFFLGLHIFYIHFFMVFQFSLWWSQKSLV